MKNPSFSNALLQCRRPETKTSVTHERAGCCCCPPHFFPRAGGRWFRFHCRIVDCSSARVLTTVTASVADVAFGRFRLDGRDELVAGDRLLSPRKTDLDLAVAAARFFRGARTTFGVRGVFSSFFGGREDRDFEARLEVFFAFERRGADFRVRLFDPMVRAIPNNRMVGAHGTRMRRTKKRTISYRRHHSQTS
jgi:hypothetical protein